MATININPHCIIKQNFASVLYSKIPLNMLIGCRHDTIGKLFAIHLKQKSVALITYHQSNRTEQNFMFYLQCSRGLPHSHSRFPHTHEHSHIIDPVKSELYTSCRIEYNARTIYFIALVYSLMNSQNVYVYGNVNV